MNHIEEYTENLQRWLETNRLAPQAQALSAPQLCGVRAPA